VLLRSWEVGDARWYVESRDEEVFKWTSEPRELTVEETESAIQRVNQSDDVISFAIVDAVSNDLLGNIALVRNDRDSRTGEVMYWLSPGGRGRGAAIKAVGRLCEWAFTDLWFDRITLKMHADNLKSRRVAERVGFRQIEPTVKESRKSGIVWFELKNEKAISPAPRDENM